MSWSVRLNGKPGNVAKALEDHSSKLEGQCKLEFDSALPHLVGLVKQNFVSTADKSFVEPVVEIEASGTGYSRDGQQLQRACSVKLGYSYAQLV